MGGGDRERERGGEEIGRERRSTPGVVVRWIMSSSRQLRPLMIDRQQSSHFEALREPPCAFFETCQHISFRFYLH